jgi:predicted nucleotidyltransferase component of viral defense system
VKYKTAGAFRRALEERLRQQSLEGGQSLTRLRKMVAFDRFLSRLAKKEPEAWIVKGGFALQLRLGDRARTTKDIDLSATNRWNREETAAHLRAAASLAFGDWFEFEVGEPAAAATGAPGNGLRFPIRCLLDGRQFEYFHLDVGFGDPVLGTPEVLTAPDVLAFADIEPATVRCYPLTTQVAEKLHTYTRTYASGETSRARDLADILLAASLEKFNNTKLRQAIEATFQARATHAVPLGMPDPPKRIGSSYRQLARELDLAWATIEEAGGAAAQFLNPVLTGDASSTWDPVDWRWTQD